MKRKLYFRGCLAAGTACLALSSFVGPHTGYAQASDHTYDSDSREHHVVQTGDTLGLISERYLGSQAKWPELWEYNPHIANPNWIFPGDIVYLATNSESSDQGASSATRDAANNSNDGKPTFEDVSSASAEVTLGWYLPLGGFVSEYEIPFAGRIIASPKESTMLSAHDTVWVGFGDDGYSEAEKSKISAKKRIQFQSPGEIEPGKIFAIVRPDGVIRGERRRDILGHRYIVLGSLTVTEVSENQWDTAIIAQSWREIERGDLLVPYERQLKFVSPIAASQDVVASIIDTMSPSFEVATHQYVYLNRGADDGVRTGNRFFIYQQREGRDRRGSKVDAQTPWVRIGQAIVVDVREKFATALITSASREIERGDRLEMYKGY